MDLLTIAARVKSESGRSGTITTVSGAEDNNLRVINAVRDAWLDLQDEAQAWKWMNRTLTAGVLTTGDQSYSSSDLGITSFSAWRSETSDYKPVAYRSDATDSKWPLQFVEYDAFRGLFLLSSQTAGPPQFWSVDTSGNLVIAPPPDATYSYRIDIDYRKANQELLVDADEPELPDRFHRILVWGALIRMSIADAAQEHFARAREEYEHLFNRLLDDQGEKITWSYRTFAPGR